MMSLSSLAMMCHCFLDVSLYSSSVIYSSPGNKVVADNNEHIVCTCDLYAYKSVLVYLFRNSCKAVRIAAFFVSSFSRQSASLNPSSFASIAVGLLFDPFPPCHCSLIFFPCLPVQHVNDHIFKRCFYSLACYFVIHLFTLSAYLYKWLAAGFEPAPPAAPLGSHRSV